MRTTTSLSAALLLTFGLSGAFGKPTAPAGGDGHGLSVRLELPWTTLLLGERIRYEYILENASDKAVPVAIPATDLKEDANFGRPVGGQPFLEAKWQRPGNPFCPLPGGPLAVEKALWPPRDGFGEEMRGWLSLPAGHRICWNQNRLPGLYFGVLSNATLEGVQAHWLVGLGRWISSAVVPVKVVSIPMSQSNQVFEGRWSSYGLGKDSCLGTAHTISIDRKLFLFWNKVRVAEVGQNDRFEHQIDKDGTNLEITITGPSGSRKLYYHLRHGLTRDTPWPIGPVSLFYPKPEPIPPAELAELRRAAAEKTEPEGTNMPDQEGSSGAGSSPGNMPPGALKEPKRWWPWFGAGLVLVVGLVIGMVIRWRRRSHRSSS